MSESQEWFVELHKIMNDPMIDWKVRRALLRHKLGMSFETASELVPECTCCDTKSEDCLEHKRDVK